jgi:hypothetical protein
MAIKTGIGVGGAQIFDTSGIMNTYAKQVANQQKVQALQAEKQAKEQVKFDEDLATAMAGINTRGVDPKTAEYIQNQYLKVKALRPDAEKINSSQKPLFLQGIKDKMNELRDFALNAKDHGSKLFTLGSKLNPYDYDESTLGRYKKLSETPYYQLTPEEKALNPTMFPKRAKFELIDDIINDTYKLAEEKADFKGEIRKGGKRANYKEVSPEIVDEILNQKFGYNPEAQAALQQLYINTTGDKQPTPEKVSKFRNDVYLKQHPLRYTGEYRDLKEPKGSGGNEEDKFSYRQQIIGGALQKDPKSIEKIRAQLPSGTTITPMTSKAISGKSTGGYPMLKIKIPSTDKLDGVTETIDLSTGEPGIRLNQLLNQYSGENVQYSKFGIEGAKARGKQFEPKKPNVKPATQTNNSSVISATRAEWKAAGWSDEQINQGVKQGVIKVK